MITPDAALSIQLIPLSCLLVEEFEWFFPEKVAQYTQLLREHPGQFMEPMMVKPSKSHPTLFAITNGKHRYFSYRRAGRHEALCVIIEEVDKDEHDLGEERSTNEQAAIVTTAGYAPVGTQSAGWHGLSRTAKGDQSANVTPLKEFDGASQADAERRY